MNVLWPLQWVWRSLMAQAEEAARARQARYRAIRDGATIAQAVWSGSTAAYTLTRDSTVVTGVPPCRDGLYVLMKAGATWYAPDAWVPGSTSDPHAP